MSHFLLQRQFRSNDVSNGHPEVNLRTLLTLVLVVLGLHLLVLTQIASAKDCSGLDYSAKRNCEKANALIEKTIKSSPPKVFKNYTPTKSINEKKIVEKKPKTDVGGYSHYSNDAMGLSFEYPKEWSPTMTNKLEMAPDSLANQPEAGRLILGFLGPKNANDQRALVGLQIEMTMHPDNVTIDDLDTDFLKLFNWDVRTNKLGTYTYYVPNMSPVTHGSKDVGSYAGKRYAFTSEMYNVKYAYTQVSIPVGKRLYRFYATTEVQGAKAGAAAIDQLLQTVEFREPTFTKSVMEKAKSSSSSRPTSKRRYK